MSARQTEAGVPTLAIQNKSDRPVFLLDGEELVGAKQNRVLNLSILVPPRTTLPIPVSCVERGRWSYRSSSFGVSPHGMYAELRAVQMSSVTRFYMSSGVPRSDQEMVWDNIAARTNVLHAASPTNAMHDVFEAKKAALDDMFADLVPGKDDHGAVFSLGGRVAGLELFEFPDMFAAYFQKIVRGYGLDALVRRNDAEFSMTEVERFVAELRSTRRRRFRGVGMGHDLRLQDEAIAGGALLFDQRVVHFAALRTSV